MRHSYCSCSDICVISGKIGWEEFPVCHGKLQVIHTPGHSDGLCILLWPEKKLLFSADLLMPASFAPIRLYYHGDPNPVSTALSTLRDFTATDVANLTILPGHGWPFEDPAGRAKLEAAYYHERSEWYYQKCAQGLDTAWKIALDQQREHGSMRKLRFFMGEAMAYLEYLAANGQVTRERQSDGLHFRI